MALRSAVIILVLLGTAAGVHAAAMYNLYEYGGTGTGATLAPGDTLHLWVRLLLTDDTFGGGKYDVLLPQENWVLQDRDYGSYGWLVNDGFFDQSVPKDKTVAGYPITITNTTYAVTPSDPDFHFESGTVFGDELDPGTYTVEDFWLQVPDWVTAGTYQVAMRNPGAYDAGGAPITVGVGDPFEITVQDIPETGTLAMVVVGLGLLGLLRRRRARCLQPQAGD